MTIIDNANRLIEDVINISKDINIVVATKYATANDLSQLLQVDFPIIFGENKVQQGEEKQKQFPNISNEWHFIGHLQRNKVKKVIKSYSLIHSVDSVRLGEEINIQSQKIDQITNILLQVNPINEESKYGFSEITIFDAVKKLKNFKNIKIDGLMCMAPYEKDEKIIMKTFIKTKQIYDRINKDEMQLKILSMGMSNDYKIAIQEGSNMIRIGRLIFK